MSVDAREERFEHVELFGKPALFINSRVDRLTVPKNLYCYDSRGSDYDPGKPVTVEPWVMVNHAGTVIMAGAVDFKGKDYCSIRRKLNFLGEFISLEEYLDDLGMEYEPREYKPQAIDGNEVALFISGKIEDEAKLGFIGYLKFTFEDCGEAFCDSWEDHTVELKTKAFRQDFQESIDGLRTYGPLKNQQNMADFCDSHEESLLSTEIHQMTYGFKLEREHYTYYLRLSPNQGDYSYVYCYDKALLQMGLTEKSEVQAEGIQQM